MNITDKKFKAEKILKELVNTNQEMYNWQKLAEELFELGEIVMKRINKDKTHKEPPIEKIIEEMGDVVLRINILAEKAKITDKIEIRMYDKLITLGGYMDDNKYIGRL